MRDETVVSRMERALLRFEVSMERLERILEAKGVEEVPPVDLEAVEKAERYLKRRVAEMNGGGGYEE